MYDGGENMSYDSVGTREEAYQQSFLAQVYAWMSFALLITTVTAWAVAAMPALTQAIFSNRSTIMGLFIVELLLVMGLTWGINKISAALATFGFFIYSMVNGLTLSVIFLGYTSESIASTFFVCAAMFGAVSIYGFITKRDLTGFGHFLFMTLIGLVIASVVNLFVASSMLYWIVSYVGVFLFMGLTAYDTQKIKRLNTAEFTGEDQERKVAILGALALYLDFINLFLFLLRFLGRRK
jgi:FtsH-binding integral membrane protein